MQKLEKSVVPPVSKLRPFAPMLIAISIFLPAMGIFHVVLDASTSVENASWSRDYRALKDANEKLEKQNARLRYDLKELTNDEADALHVTDDRSLEDVRACIKQPDGILVTPWALSMPHWELKLHNPEPILSTSPEGDFWFTPGSACSLNRTSAVKITRWQDIYILQPWNPPGQFLSYASCPGSAYHLVSETNTAVRNAVFRACLTKIKARDIGPAILNR